MKCILCGKNESKSVFRENGIDILKCENCGHIFSSYRQKDDYEDYYGERIVAEDHFWWKDAHEKMYEDFCEKFICGGRGKLLDVGCGLGYFVKKNSAYPDWEVFGYEVSGPAVEFAKNSLKLKNVFRGRVEDSSFPDNYFDVITLWDVIEHIPNPHLSLRYLNKILKRGGFIFMHTPNADVQLFKAKLKKIFQNVNPHAHYMEAKDHVNIYTPKTIKVLLAKNNFKKIKFIHLKPIQSVSGSKNIFLKLLKNFWFYISKIIFFTSAHKVNVDNLFVIAEK
ncbi:MAG: class I SAM-dependent methyltransferase [bacterium]